MVEVAKDNPFLEGNFDSKYSFKDAYHFWFSGGISRNVLKENE